MCGLCRHGTSRRSAAAASIATVGTHTRAGDDADANHSSVIFPDTDAGQTTLQVISDILTKTP